MAHVTLSAVCCCGATMPIIVRTIEYPAVLCQEGLSLSRLNHGPPGCETHPEVMQGTADLHHEIADTRLPQADPVFHNPTPLDAAVDVLDPEPRLVERLVGQVLLQGQLRTAGLLRRHEDFHLGEREGQEAQILQEPAPRRQGIRRRVRNGLIMGTTAIGVTEKEDEEQSVDEEHIFYRMVFVLAAITRGLFSKVLGADDPSF